MPPRRIGLWAEGRQLKRCCMATSLHHFTIRGMKDLFFQEMVKQGILFPNVVYISFAHTKKDIQNPDYSRHVSMGWNYRMPELCAAVALAQVENIDTLVEQRCKVAKLFNNAVADIKPVSFSIFSIFSTIYVFILTKFLYSVIFFCLSI